MKYTAHPLAGSGCGPLFVIVKAGCDSPWPFGVNTSSASFQVISSGLRARGAAAARLAARARRAAIVTYRMAH